MVALAVAFLFVQEQTRESGADILIEQLGAEEIDVREAATNELFQLGSGGSRNAREVRKEVETRAANHNDPEVAGRARWLLAAWERLDSPTPARYPSPRIFQEASVEIVVPP